MFKDFGEWAVSPASATPDWVKAVGGIAYHQGEADMYAAIRAGHFDADAFFRVIGGDVVAAATDFSEIQGAGHFIGYSGEGSADMVAEFHAWMDNPDPARRFVWDGEAVRRHCPSRTEMRAAALERINAEHATLLGRLTGNATSEERDTWKAKDEAALAFEAGTATPGQSEMLTAEADGAGIPVARLVQIILANAAKFQILTGQAAGVRAKAKAAVKAATRSKVPMREVAPAIEAALSQMSKDAAALLEGAGG